MNGDERGLNVSDPPVYKPDGDCPQRPQPATPQTRRSAVVDVAGLSPKTKTTPKTPPSWRRLSACRVPTHRDARPPGPRLLPLRNAHPLANALTSPARRPFERQRPNPQVHKPTQPQSWTLRDCPPNEHPPPSAAKPRIPAGERFGEAGCQAPLQPPRPTRQTIPSTRRNPRRGLSSTSPTRKSTNPPTALVDVAGLSPKTKTRHPTPPNHESQQGRGLERRAAKPPLQQAPAHQPSHPSEAEASAGTVLNVPNRNSTNPPISSRGRCGTVPQNENHPQNAAKPRIPAGERFWRGGCQAPLQRPSPTGKPFHQPAEALAGVCFREGLIVQSGVGARRHARGFVLEANRTLRTRSPEQDIWVSADPIRGRGAPDDSQ